MLANQAEACSAVTLLAPASLSAGANHGSYIDLSKYIGHAAIIVDVGAVTGSVIVKVEDATAEAGTNLADVTGAVTASLTTADTAVKLVVPIDKLRQWVRVTATVTTGPIVMGVVALMNPQYV